MANSVTISLTDQAWTRVATGPGYATFTAHSHGTTWAITDSTTAPTPELLHIAPFLVDRSLSLATGGHLWLRGRGNAAVVAENPV